MINHYPQFSKLDVSHRNEIREITTRFEPYSDFNFTSLFAWNTNEDTTISILNENLVICMPDYITGKPIYSILGKNKIEESINTLLIDIPELSLVPKIVIDNISHKQKYEITEERDHFDYIYKVSEHAALPGGRYRGKRKRIGKFMNNSLDQLSLRKIRFNEVSDKILVKRLFDEWVFERNRTIEEADSEREALNRLIENATHFDLMGIFVYIDDLCVGYSINEVLPNSFAICHFQKAKLKYEYIDIFLSSLAAKELYHYGCKYINWEQDLGINGLRILKESYLPEFYLKKYKLKLN